MKSAPKIDRLLKMRSSGISKKVADTVDAMNDRNNISVPLSTIRPYECGALLLSYLSFPDKETTVMRSEAQIASCGLALNTFSEDEPDWSSTEQVVRPMYLTYYSYDELYRCRTIIANRIEDRIAAARIALPLFDEFHKMSSTYPKPTSIADGIDFACSILDIKDPVNVASRIWKPSLPVIHAAIALTLAIRRSDHNGTYFSLIRHHDFIKYVVEMSEFFENRILNTPKLRKYYGSLIKFRLT